MKPKQNRMSVLSRVPVNDTKQVFEIHRRLALWDMLSVERANPDDPYIIDVSGFGKIMVSSDLMDYEFIPSTDLKRDMQGIIKNPKSYLTSQIMDQLGVGGIDDQ